MPPTQQRQSRTTKNAPLHRWVLTNRLKRALIVVLAVVALAVPVWLASAAATNIWLRPRLTAPPSLSHSNAKRNLNPPLVLGVIYVDDSWVGTTPGADPDGIGPATNFGVDSFATIQDGINAVDPGGIVNVYAGTYAEQLSVNKAISLLGPNAAINPNTGSRVAEAKIIPISSDPLNPGFSGPIAVYLQVPGITFKGFTVDGDNPSLTSGVIFNGADVDAEFGIYGDGAGDLNAVVQNNIVQNVGEMGIWLNSFGFGGTRNGNTLIHENKVDNLLGAFGQGLRISDDCWANVTNNVATRVRSGIVIENYSGNVTTHPASIIDHNQVTSFRLGIRHNLHYVYAAPGFTISNNTVQPYVQSPMPPQVTTPTAYQGIRVESIQQTVAVTVQNNTLTGNKTAMQSGGYTRNEGLNVTNASTTSPNILFNHNHVRDWIRGAFHETPAVPDFECNLFFGNTTGVLIDAAASNGLIAHQNSIFSNGAGMQNNSAATVDATNNYWGQPTGPTSPGNPGGTGDTVSTNVTFSPFLAAHASCAQPNVVYVDDDFTGPNNSDPDGAGPLTAIGYDAFPTIQGGINGVTAGGTVIVYAGNYKENPTVNKSVTIQGPNVGVAGSAVRAAEANVTTNGNQTAVFTVTSSNVTIDGFTIDGDDPLIAGPALLASGDDTNVQYGVRPTGAINNLTVQNNIVKRVFIGLRGDTNPSQGNVITNNWFDSVGNFDFGYCVSIRNNFYANITNNKMTRAWTGVHINNHNGAGGPASFNVTGNEIHSYAGGILYWLQYNGATGATISNNQMTAEAAAVTNNFGVLMVSIQNAVNPTFTSNTITGHNYGIGLFNVPTTSTITLGATNSVSNSSLAGIFLTDNLNFNPIGTTNFLAGGPGAAATVNVTGMPITGSTGIGLKVEGGTNLQTLNATSNTITGFATGLALQSANARINAHFNRIISTTTAIDNPGNVVTDLENNWWGCNAGPNNTGCGTVNGSNADFNPWFVVAAQAVPNSITPGGTSNVSVDLTRNSDNIVPASTPPDTPVSYNAAPNGTMTPPTGTITAGAASSQFTSTTVNSAVVTVTVDNENLNLPITIAAPSFSVNDVTMAEGNAGTTSFTFTITKTGAGAASVDYATLSGTAAAPADFTAIPATTLNFLSADTTKQVTVDVNGDTTLEANEAFRLRLSNAVNATISDIDGLGTINNDDGCVAFSTVYVDQSWAGTATGDDPDGGGPATSFGCDSFATVQEGINAVAPGGTVIVNAGTYDEDLTISNAGLKLLGAGAGVVNVRGPMGGPGSTIAVTASNVTIAGFTITRLGNNTTDWNNPSLNSAGISISSQSVTNVLIRDNVITGNRTGIDINNSNGHTVRNNVIDFNRTGMIMRNQTDSLIVVENFITNNWTVGIVFLDASGGTNTPIQTAQYCVFSNNNMSGNWYGQIVDRQTGGSLPAPGANPKNFKGNWFGTTSPVVTTANSAEPGYAAQIPVAYGGSATPPGGQPDIEGPASANFQYIPFLQSGTDTNIETTPGRGTNGFQGVANAAIVVRSSSLKNWMQQHATCGAAGTGSQAFVVGPLTAPIGEGSLQYLIGSNGDSVEAMRSPDYHGVRLDALTQLGYSTFAATAGGQAPYMRLDVDNDNNGSLDDSLFFEPVYQNGGYSTIFPETIPNQCGVNPNCVTTGQWQTWNTLTGGWWSNVESAGGPPLISIARYVVEHPDARIINSSGFGGVRISSGCGAGAWDNFDGNTDDLIIGVSGANARYDFEPLPRLSIDDVTHNEGQTGTTSYTFTVSLSRDSDQTVTVSYQTANDSAIAPTDYTALPLTVLTFNPGETSKTFTVDVNGDMVHEGTEQFFVNLSSPNAHAVIADGQGVGTITEDDTPPSFAIDDVSHSEGNSGTTLYTFTVTKTGTTEATSSVDFQTQNGSATLVDSDYQTNSGTLSFGPSDTTMPVTVLVNGDTTFEPNEAFTVHLLNASNATILDADGTGSIQNDDCGTSATVYVDDNWVGTSFGADPDAGGPATYFGCDSFATIQDGINGVAPGGTVIVYAGTYQENVLVNKSVSLLGPNAAIDPNTGSRVAEAIVLPAVVETSVQGSTSGTVFRVGSNSGHINATIKGFTIDGQNPSLINGRTLNGLEVHTGAGIINSTGSFDTNPGAYDTTMVVQYNIIQNLERYGVLADNVPARPAVTGTDVSYNKIDNLPSGNNFGGGRGRGVAFEENVYGSVTNNVITRVNVGWQDDNYNLASPGAATVVSNNTIRTYHRGIFHNLQYQDASAATISNNSIFVETTGDFPASTTNFGIELASIATGVGVSVSNNNSTGNVYGILLWNLPTTADITVTGGTLSGNDYGVYATSNDPQFGAGAASHSFISGVTITNATVAGIGIDDGGNIAQTQLGIDGNTSVSGGPVGLLMTGPGARVVNNNLNNTSFTGQTGRYISLTSGASAGLEINGTGVTFDGLTGATATLAQNYAIEDKITHAVDEGTVGFVRVKAGDVFVTPNSFTAVTLTPSIQRGVDAATAGNTLHAAAGLYPNNVNVNKALTLQGANLGVAGAGVRGAESIIRTNGNAVAVVAVTGVSNVTIDGFYLDGDDPLVAGQPLKSGDDSNVQYAVRPTGTVNNLTMANNIAKKVFIGLRGDAAGQGNLVNNNWFDSIGNFDFGYCVSIRNNFYANVTNNKMTRAWTGVHINNHNGAGGPASFNITGNEIHSYAGGILYWLQYNGATGATISNNQMTAEAAAVANNFGVLMVSIQDAVNPTFTNNTMTGHNYGVGLFNVPTSSTITLGATNSISNSSVAGVFLTDNLNFNPIGTTNFLAGGPGAAATVNVTGMPITGSTGIGIKVEGGTNLQTLNATSNTITGFTTGLALQSANARINAHFNRIISTTTAIDNPGNVVTNLENNWWGCNAGPGNTGCGTVNGTGADFNPWIVLGASASPTSIPPGGSSTVTADMTLNSDNVAPSGTDFVPQVSVTFSATNGTIGPSPGTITSGQAVATFTSNTNANGQACATVDTQQACTAAITVVLPSFSIDDVTMAEGNAGTTSFTFTITKTGAGPASVDYATVNGTATAPSDFTAIPTTTLSFLSGDLSKQVTVQVKGDTANELSEAFTVHLSNPVTSTISDSDGLGTITNDDSCGALGTVYVNKSWLGTAAGDDPDAGGPATVFGCDSFATIQEGVTAVTSGGTVNVYAGTYEEDVTISQPLTLVGIDGGTKTVLGAIGGGGSTIQVAASNVTIAGLTITRQGNNTTDWNNPGLNTAGIAIQGQAITNTLIRDNLITGNRTGIDINNSNGHTVRNNTIDNNRTGMILRNQTDNLTVVENFITNNWTVGIVFLDGSGGTNSPVQTARHSTFSNNDLSANWYGQIVDRQTGGSLPAPGTTNLKNFRGNWFGTTTPVITTANSAEPGYAAQIPVAFGGTATPPGGQPDIAGPASANFKIDPILTVGTDTNVETTPGRGTNGFQGVANTVVVEPSSMHGWVFFDDFPGTGTGSGGFADGPGTAPRGAGSAFLTVDANGRHALGTAAYAGTRMDDITELKYWSYQNNNSNTAAAIALQFDIDYDLNDADNAYMGRLVFEPYITPTNTVQQGVWQNWDALAGQWYGTRTTVTVNGVAGVAQPCQQATPCTWAQVLGLFPNAGVGNTPVRALLFKAGGPVGAGGFNGNVDDFSLKVNTAAQTYDFEPNPHLSINDVSHNEGNAGTTSYDFTVTLSRPSSTTVTVEYVTADSSAVAPGDFTGIGTTQLVFNPGETTKPVTVLVNGDLTNESDEQFFVNLSNPSASADITDNQGVGTIVNDDAQPSFSISDVTQNEGDAGTTNFTFTVTKTGATGLASSVQFQTVDGTATVADNDYAFQSGTLNFGPADTAMQVTVLVNGDATVEPNEAFTVHLLAPSGATISDADGTGSITNDDTDVTLSVSVASVSEDGAANLVYTFTRSGSVSNTLVVNFSVSGGATFSTDYTQLGATTFTSSSGTVTFGAGNATAQVTVDPITDSTVEPDETVVLTLTAGTGYGVGTPGGITGTVTNDDSEVSVAVSPLTVLEDGATNLVYTFTRNGDTTGSLTANFSVAGSATFGTDYTQSGATAFNATSGSVTFAAGNSTATVTVDPTTDVTVEPDETAILTVASGTGYSVGTPGAATGTITNDDTDVSVAISPSTALEDGATNLVYTFTRNGDTTGALTVNFSVAGTATLGTDYTQTGAAAFNATSGSVTFAAGNPTATVTIDPSTDVTVEPDETAILTVTSGTGYGVGTPGAATGTITNDDADVSVAVSPSTALEDGATNLVYTFTRNGNTTGALTANFSVAGSATFGTDYTQSGAAAFNATSGSVTFAAGNSTATVTVDPTTDVTVEPDETAILTVTSGTGYGVGTPAAATGTITNDDTDVSVAVSTSTVLEDGATNLVYTFTRNGNTTGALTVNFSVAGTATFGTDYTQSGATAFNATTGAITFAAGSSTATVTIDPTTDGVVEPDETAILTVTSGTGYNVATPAAATGTITNDDADVTLSVSPASVSEDAAANLVYTFTRNGNTTGALTVNFSVAGTATFNTDYTQSGAATFTAASGTVTFAAGNSTASVNIDPSADPTVEPDETVIITVTSGTGYNVATPAAATGTITNDEGDVSVAVSPSTVPEDGATNLVYTFTRGGVNTDPLTVNFTVAGTGTFNSDYTQSGAATFSTTNGTVTFAAGSSTATVTIDPTTDVTVEPDETVILTVASGSGYGVGTPSAATGTIVNDDGTTGGSLQFSAAGYNIGEGSFFTTITVRRLGDTTGAVSVNYATPDDSAATTVVPCETVTGIASPRCDFTTAVGTLHWASGDNAPKSFIVLISEDDYVEGPEGLTLTLSNPTGGAQLGSPSTAILTIDDDATEPTQNPIDGPPNFVRQHYHDFLNREPDPSGFDFWVGNFPPCGGDPQCIEVRRINVSASFYLSIEFQGTGYFVERLYKTSYGDATGTSTIGGPHTLAVPIVKFSEALPDTQEIGRGVVVLAPGWEAALEANKVAFTEQFVQRARFLNAYPLSMTPAQFVDALNANAGNPLSTAERNQLVSDLTGGAKTRAQVLRAIADDQDLINAEFNRGFVLMQYFGFLRRNPNAAPDLDHSGYDFWLQKLNQFNGNFIDAEMVKAFLTSIEYRARSGRN